MAHSRRRLDKIFSHLSSASCIKDQNDTSTDSMIPNEILEYHFHVYFFQNNAKSVKTAKWIQNELISKVKNHEFLVVLNGIGNEILPDLDTSKLFDFNMKPVGPHPCGSFEVWVPKQYFVKVLSWFMLNRGNLSVLLHPLTPQALKDHFERSMWLGHPFKIDPTVLKDETGPFMKSEHPELKLGYAYDKDSPYAPNNWLC